MQAFEERSVNTANGTIIKVYKTTMALIRSSDRALGDSADPPTAKVWKLEVSPPMKFDKGYKFSTIDVNVSSRCYSASYAFVSIS